MNAPLPNTTTATSRPDDQLIGDRSGDDDVIGFALTTTDGTTISAAGTDLVLDADTVRAGYLGPDWIGPALIAVLFIAVVAAILVISGGTHWQAGY